MSDGRCCAMVGTGGPWSRYRCTKAGKVEVNGKLYCGIHNPIRLQAIREETDKRWAEEARAARKKRQIELAAPDLLEAQTMGNTSTPEFLEWIADRLVHVYGESLNADFVLSLRKRAKAGRAAIAKAIGEAA